MSNRIPNISMADSAHISNGFSPICAPHNIDGEVMTQPNIVTYPYHTEMSNLSPEKYRNSMGTRAGNFNQNAHMSYCESVTNQSTISDYNRPETVSSQCTTQKYDVYKSDPDPESTTSTYNWHRSTSPNLNPYQSVSYGNPYRSVPDQSSTLNDNGYQHVNPHEVMNIPPIQNDDCSKSEQMVHSTKLSSVESSTSSLTDGRQRRHTKYTLKQKAILKSAFERDNSLNLYSRRKLAKEFQVDAIKVSIWFRNLKQKLQRMKQQKLAS